MSHQVKVLEGKKVYLRPMEVEDADVLYHSLNNDTEMRRLTGTHKIFSKLEIEESFQSLGQDKSRVGFAIVRQEDDKLVGDIALNEMYFPNNEMLILELLFLMLIQIADMDQRQLNSC